MSKTKVLLTIIGMIVLVVVLAAGSLLKSLTKTPETFIVGEEFVMHLAERDYDGASALAVTQLQDPDSRAGLVDLVDKNPTLFTTSTQVKFTGRGIDDDIRYAYGTISSSEGESFIYLEFVDQNGETRVSYLSFNEEDVPQYTSADTSAE